MADTEDRSISLDELCHRWGVSRSTARRWIRAGELVAWRLPGGSWRVPLQAVWAYERGRRAG